MKDSFSSIRRSIRKPKLKLLVSFNGSFSRRLPSRKLRYVGGETHIISVEWNTSISKLKRRIADLICPKAAANFSKLCLNYHVSKSLCGGDDGEEEDPVLFLLESEDDLRYMIKEYQTMELKGQLHSARFWVFVCNTNDDFINDCANVNSNCSFGKALRAGLDDSEKNGSENLSIVSNKYEGKTKKLGDDFLRKMVLKKQLWVRNLNGIASFRGCKEHSDSDLARETSICQSSPKQLCSVPLNCGSEIVNSSGDSYKDNVLDFKRTSDYIMTSASLPSTERRRRGYGGSIHNHRFGVNEARSQRTCPYQIRKRSNANESGNNRPFRLDHPGLALFSNVSKQGIPSRSQSDALKKPLSRSDYYETQREQKFIDHADIFNPPCWGIENILGQVDDHVPHAGSKVDVYENSLPGARILDANTDHLTSFGAELDGHLSNSQDNCYNCCDSVISELSGDSKLLDVESSYETLDVYQGGAKDFKNSGSSFDLSLHNLSLELSGKMQLQVPCAQRDTSEAIVQPVSNVLDLMDEVRINLGSESDVSSDSSSNKCKKDDDDKSKASQQSRKSNPSIVEMYENKKTSSCLKANNGIPTEVATRYSHLATRELQIIKNADLEYVKELGQGTYGTVYHGKWKGSDVAIKRIKPSCFTDGAKQEDRLVADFWKEANVLGQLHHPNIVALYGVVTAVNCLATVTEYMVNGSLKQVLRRKDRTIDRRKRLILAMDAAFGMEYLHEKNIIHFDLKSHNFLVNMRDPQRPVCKIGDLGLSKIKQRTLVSGGIRGTIPWMAPELLSGRKLVSEKVDVFSFGIVMWELLTGEEPYADMRSEEIVAGIIKGNLRPEIPSWCDPVWRSLMESCWSSNPDYRPSFLDVAKQLRTMAASMNIK